MPAVDQNLVSTVREARRCRIDGGDALLYVGLVRPHKNLDRAIRAFAISEFAARGGRFAIVGNKGPALVAEHPGVVQLGPVNDAELVSWYSRARAVIVPSIEEGFGLPVLEALSAGIPVCCSDIEPFRTVAQGRAIVFDPICVESIANAIDRVVVAAPPAPIRMTSNSEFARSVLDGISDLDYL